MSLRNCIIITGGAGFIGSEVVRQYLSETETEVVVLDKLTYAGNLVSLNAVSASPKFHFYQGDINDRSLVDSLFSKYSPRAILHLAAESHVDRSIDGPAEFLVTNIMGTFNLLESSLAFWKKEGKPENFRFQHISTDEVYGSLGDTGLFKETTSYDPSSPYSASKASSDHLVRAWNRTYDLPVLLTNCSNNYGPYHFPEKLIPLMIMNARKGKQLPVYGDGLQIRDWLYVGDHARALRLVLEKGKVGETYNVGGDSERKNIEVVKLLCEILDRLSPNSGPHARLITYVKDRPGHDRRYAIDCSKIKKELGWSQMESFESGLEKTIDWYIKNDAWTEKVLMDKYAGERLGLKT